MFDVSQVWIKITNSTSNIPLAWNWLCMLFHLIIIINNFFLKVLRPLHQIPCLYCLHNLPRASFSSIEYFPLSARINFRSAMIFFQYTRQELLPSNVPISISAYLDNSFDMCSYYEISLLVLCYHMRSSFVLPYCERCHSTEFYRLFLFVNRVYMSKQ